MSEWKLVPVEADEEMLRAGVRQIVDRPWMAAVVKLGVHSALAEAWDAIMAVAPSPWQPIETMPTEDWHSRRPDGGGVCVARFTQTNRAAFFVWIDPATEQPTYWAPLLPPPAATSACESSPAIDVAQTPQTPASEARNRPSGDCNAEGK